MSWQHNRTERQQNKKRNTKVKMVSFTTVALVLVAGAIYYYFFKKKERYPPGPIGLPVFGNLLSIGTAPHLRFDEWGKKYGPIFSVDMGTNPTVVLTDAAMIREALNESVFSGKPDNKAFTLLTDGKNGVLSSDGESWVEQRRFTLRTLRDFGFGKSKIETIVMEEVHAILNWMKKSEGEPISLDLKFRLSVLNALSALTTGERHDLDDPKLSELLDSGNKTFNEAIRSGAVFFPQFAERFPEVTGWNRMVKATDQFREIFERAVQSHEKNPAGENDARDLIDAYQQEIKRTTDPRSSFYKEQGRKSLVAVVGDLHVAGSETVSQTLRWAILYILRHPEVQKKLQKEIEEVIGQNRLPCLADKPNMRYTEALIMEVLRISSLVPMGVFHNTMADVEFHGHSIPKDTMIITNLYSVHWSKETWVDPENFRPERFLSADGKIILKNDALIPFAVGKRQCIGETLARDELFLYITSIFQRFEIKPDPANPEPSLEPNGGFVLAAKPYSVVMKDRLV